MKQIPYKAPMQKLTTRKAKAEAKTSQVSVNFPPALLAALDAACEQHEHKRASLIRLAVRQYLKG